jgi:hypothetical protein
MPKCPILFAPAVAAGLFSTVITLNPNWVLAAGDCIEQPNREPAAGGHWYYRTDRLNNRKCWYLTEPEPVTSQAEGPKAAPSNETTLKQEDTRPAVGRDEVSPARFLNRAQPNAFEE